MSWNSFTKTLGLSCSIFVMAAACSPKEDALGVEKATEHATHETHDDHSGHGQDEHKSHSPTVSQPDVSIDASVIQIENGIIRPPLGGKTMTAGYFTITLGQDDKIVAATSDIAENIELHTHEMNDGMMQMRKVEAVEVKAGVPLEFKPKGLHLMVFGVGELKEGETADVVLSLESGRTATAQFTIAVPDVSKGSGHKH